MNSDKNCRSDEGGQVGEVVKQEFHILAVDDSLIDRKLLERLLTISSYQVTCVESGDKALEYLGLEMDSNNDNIIPQQKEIDEYGTSDSSSSSSSIIPQPNQEQVSKVVVNMIMTDYSMPGISGYELLKRVKDSSWKDIPVVVMSSEDIPSRINKCLESGAEEFLLKPVKLSDLSNLHSHLQTKSASNGTLSPNNSSCDETTTNGEDNTNSILSTTTIPNTVEVSKCNGTSSSSILHSNKRKATSTAKLTSASGAAALSEMMPRVTELPVS